MIIVSVHFLHFSFMPVYVRQDGLSGTQVYVSLHQFRLVGRDVELDNRKKTEKRKGEDREKTGRRQVQDREKTETK